MNWNGLSLALDSEDCIEVVEVSDEAVAFGLVYDPSVLGPRARGSQKPNDPDFAPGLAVWISDDGRQCAEVRDEDALCEWIDSRLSNDERDELESERDRGAAEDAIDRATDEMRERSFA